jgi:hypothetical protein
MNRSSSEPDIATASPIDQLERPHIERPSTSVQLPSKSPSRSASRRRPATKNERRQSRLRSAIRSFTRIFTAYPLRLEGHALANLRAVKNGPRLIADLARSVYDDMYGVGCEPTLKQQEEARQAFTLLAQAGAIGCQKRQQSDGSWAEIRMTPIGRDIVTNPGRWFEDGYLLRKPRP